MLDSHGKMMLMRALQPSSYAGLIRSFVNYSPFSNAAGVLRRNVTQMLIAKLPRRSASTVVGRLAFVELLHDLALTEGVLGNGCTCILDISKDEARHVCMNPQCACQDVNSRVCGKSLSCIR